MPAPRPQPTPFNPASLRQHVIAMPLRQQLQDEQNRLEMQVRLAIEPAAPNPASAGPGQQPGPSPGEVKLFDIIIDLNLRYPGGREGAMRWVVDTLNELIPTSQVVAHRQVGLDADKTIKNLYSQQYLFVQAEGDIIQQLVQRDQAPATPAAADPAPAALTAAPIRPAAIYHIWTDFELTPHVNKSIATIKGDAARTAYSASGEGIVWAVLDSGIDYTHPHFAPHHTLELELPLLHTDFTQKDAPPAGPLPTAPPALSTLPALTDAYGHGTHVAGIIAGKWGQDRPPIASNSQHEYKELGDTEHVPVQTVSFAGMAAKCKLLSLKVLGDAGTGTASNVIAAINLIQQLNGYGRHLLVHGVNISAGYIFEPEWFACGQSPLCVEINRLVQSGVVVVVAAGNSGYGTMQTFDGAKASGIGLTINDPGNADLAITVGSTHREMPHIYGVSYFSSKGPTGDGRPKPDLVAPGERILSCAAGLKKRDPEADPTGPALDYVEDTGTSMAAPHVSGAVAAFLSIRREFIGRPQQVKDIFLNSATDLKRERYFQGSGLVDLMRAIQSV